MEVEIRYERVWALSRIPRHEFTAWDGRHKVATLTVNGDQSDWIGGQELLPWTIFNVSVRHTHQRQGIATALLVRAREVLPEVRHSPYRNADGDAWARADKR